MSKKDDKAMVKGFEIGGADSVQFFSVGKKYRRAEMVIMGRRREVQRIPSSSHLDAAAMQRKARDMAKRFVKYDTDKLTW